MGDSLKKLARARFPDIPDDVFEEAPVSQWLDMLGFEAQIEIAEEMSRLQIEEQPSPLGNLFRTLPLDVIASMLKEKNNSALRALCRVDRFSKLNCKAIIDKIGFLRHGNAFTEMTYRHNARFRQLMSDNPVEALISFEASSILLSSARANTNSRFFFQKGQRRIF